MPHRGDVGEMDARETPAAQTPRRARIREDRRRVRVGGDSRCVGGIDEFDDTFSRRRCSERYDLRSSVPNGAKPDDDVAEAGAA